MSPRRTGAQRTPPGGGLFALLKPYRGLVTLLVVLTIVGNGLTLVVPKLISRAIDAYTQRAFVLSTVVWQFFVVAFLVFALNYLQNIAQTYASERVARDLRMRLAAKIATQSYSSIETLTPAKLLTNLTSDVDGVKLFVSQAVAMIIASLFLIVGASVMLLTINWRLGLSVLGVVPVVGGTFFFALRKVRVLFKRGQEAIDWLNRVINESILGATLIRILNSQRFEAEKFTAANTESRDIGLAILRIMSAMIPAITLAVNLATIIILLLGGRLVILGSMTLGDFTAFNSYLALPAAMALVPAAVATAPCATATAPAAVASAPAATASAPAHGNGSGRNGIGSGRMLGSGRSSALGSDLGSGRGSGLISGRGSSRGSGRGIGSSANPAKGSRRSDKAGGIRRTSSANEGRTGRGGGSGICAAAG